MATAKTSREMIPTMCDGNRWSTGKPKPVTLVATVVTRNSAVHPLSRSHDDESRSDSDQAQEDVNERERRRRHSPDHGQPPSPSPARVFRVSHSGRVMDAPWFWLS